MRRSEIERWVEQHGQADYQEEYVEVPNPNRTSRTDPPTITVKKVTWVGEDGQRLSVIDAGEYESVSDDSTPALVDVKRGEPTYQVVAQGSNARPAQDNRTPEARRHESEVDAQRQRNKDQTGYWETDQERRTRENQEATQARASAAQEASNALERDRYSLERERFGLAQNADTRAQQQEERASETAARSAKNEEERLGIERGRFGLEERRANQPTILGTPTDENRNIAMFDPTTGQVVSQANPLYDEAKANAKRVQEELALAIQMNRLTADQAAQQYTEWFKKNVEVPFMMASEARARAAEKRQALEAEQRNRQFAAQNQIQRAQVGQQAAGQMLNAEMALNPYRVGPAFGEQMSSAITSLAQGGKMDTNASAGINFTKEAFEYDAPDLKKIARDATKEALKGITPYDPGDEEMPTADYGEWAMPTPAMLGSAPATPNYIDTNSMYQSWVNSRYPGPGE